MSQKSYGGLYINYNNVAKEWQCFFGSGNKHELDICTKSYANGLGAI